MITIITGTPGAGKTLYTISKLLLDLVGTSIKQEVAGELVEHPRTIYTNIKGLMIDHELIDGGDNGGLRNWHQWAKPGSVVVFDEVQKVWTPRANGSKVPDDIQALETHRHMGVDFILITQGLALVDRNLHMLCGRHLHVRRVAGLGFAVVYEWDHASRTLMYSKALAKHPWKYDRKVFKLYHSSDLHTKQKQSVPTLAYFIVFGLVAFGFLVPFVKGRMQERFGKPAAAAAVATVETGKGVAPPDPKKSLLGDSEASVSVVEHPKPADRPEFAGCVALGSRCSCYTEHGKPVEVELGRCSIETGRGTSKPVDLSRLAVPDQAAHLVHAAAVERDAAAFEWLRGRATFGPIVD